MTYDLYKSPEMLAHEHEQRRKDEDKEKRAHGHALLKQLSIQELRIPPLPAAAALLIDMCRDINVNYRQLAKVIESDPGLAVRLLRVANSAYYGQTRKITSIVRALTVIGLKEVRTIGLSYKLMSVIKDFVSSSFDFESYWEKSLLIAVLAKEIARELGSEALDEAFLAGLLQDIGIVILRTNMEQEYETIAAAAVAGADVPLTDLEQQVFGTDHAHLGADACAAWKFSAELCNAIRRHHQPPAALTPGSADAELPAVAYASGLMPDFLLGAKPMVILADLENRGIIAPQALEPIFSRSHLAFGALSGFFEKHLPKDAQIANMMEDVVGRLQKMGAAQLRVCEPPE